MMEYTCRRSATTIINLGQTQRFERHLLALLLILLAIIEQKQEQRKTISLEKEALSQCKNGLINYGTLDHLDSSIPMIKSFERLYDNSTLNSLELSNLSL